MSEDIPVVESSGNVFAELGLPDAADALTKAELAMAIAAIVQERRMTQVQAAEALDIPQPKVSALLRGQLSGFSLERLLRFLNALGHEVRIVVGEEAEDPLHAALLHIDMLTAGRTHADIERAAGAVRQRQGTSIDAFLDELRAE